MNKEEDEAELGLVEDISNIIRHLEGQIVWMQKIEHEFDSLQNRLNAIDDWLQTVDIIRSNIESLLNLKSLPESGNQLRRLKATISQAPASGAKLRKIVRKDRRMSCRIPHLNGEIS